MLSACKNPFPTHGCGQCEYCRVILRMDDVNRLKLEYGLRPYSFFITLTYDDLHLPVFSGLAELWPEDLNKFIDNIRNDLPKITIYAVGEYGGHLFGTKEAKRAIHPHYHLAIFSDDKSIGEKIRAVCEKKWRYGHCHILLLSSGLIDYITGYVSKKLTNKDSMVKIMSLNIQPEFTFKSRRPAIGDVSERLVEITEQYGKLEHLTIDGKQVVIPKYLRFKVKDQLLKWDLDLDCIYDALEYERRKYEKKIETLQELSKKNSEEKVIIAERGIKRSDIKKQLVANFESKIALKKHTKGKLL